MSTSKLLHVDEQAIKLVEYRNMQSNRVFNSYIKINSHICKLYMWIAKFANLSTS